MKLYHTYTYTRNYATVYLSPETNNKTKSCKGYSVSLFTQSIKQSSIYKAKCKKVFLFFIWEGGSAQSEQQSTHGHNKMTPMERWANFNDGTLKAIATFSPLPLLQPIGLRSLSGPHTRVLGDAELDGENSVVSDMRVWGRRLSTTSPAYEATEGVKSGKGEGKRRTLIKSPCRPVASKTCACGNQRKMSLQEKLSKASTHLPIHKTCIHALLCAIFFETDDKFKIM